MTKTLSATLIVLAAAIGSAAAQTPSPAPKAKAAAPAPAPAKSAATQAPADTAKAMPQAERTAIQSDLAWLGLYNGLIDGEVSERMVAAIKTFQKDRNGKQTGVLNPQERATLATDARAKQGQSGWKIVADQVNGSRLGLPTKLVPQQSAGASGTRWTSAQGQIQVETWRNRDAGLTLAAAADREAKEPNRKVLYRVVKPDFFVLSGLQGLKKFYIRGQIRGSEVRGLTILYDQATEGTMDPLVVLMSSAFAPFPAAGAQVAGAPAPRKKVEYATGVFVSGDGFILTDRQAVDGCQSIVVAGHGNADRIAEDKEHDLALLRIYGASGLKPLAVVAGAAKPALILTGIADPQSQGGGAAVTSANATAASGANNEMTLSPAPAFGFSGAPAVDSDGRFAGLALLRASIVAGTDNNFAPQATLVGVDHIRAFMNANKVTPSSGAAGDAKASVLRVICVRK